VRIKFEACNAVVRSHMKHHYKKKEDVFGTLSLNKSKFKSDQPIQLQL